MNMDVSKFKKLSVNDSLSIYNVFVVGALVVMVCFVLPDPTIVTLLSTSRIRISGHGVRDRPARVSED